MTASTATTPTTGTSLSSSSSSSTTTPRTRTTRTTTTPTITANHVLLFLPNLIGYSRVIMALSSFVIMLLFESLWFLAVCLYVGSFIGDLFDGWVARKFHQTSTFGSVLDMVTDRCATLGLLMILTAHYFSRSAASAAVVGGNNNNNNNKLLPVLLVCLAILDVSSHWCQMYASLAVDQGHHHKSEQANQKRNFLVRWFYKYYWFFGYLCVGAELTYVLLYVQLYVNNNNNNNSSSEMVVSLLLYLCVPGCAMKQLVNIAQLTSSCHAIAELDAQNYNNNNSNAKQK